jgi:quercetin dioxygenase-like cupin family protein
MHPVRRRLASIEDACGGQRETANAYRADPPAGGCVAVEVSYLPGGAAAPHRHSDSAFIYAYVVSGQIVSQVEGQPEHIYRAGECWYETPGAHHLISRNASNTEPAKLLAVFVADTGDNALTTPDHAGGSR